MTELQLLGPIRENLILPEQIGLYAIIRDELMNPAGGIADYLECILPFVKFACVVDTGSRDGTREYLEEAVKQFSNLKVYDRKWRDYSHARNLCLEKKETEFALFLDGDERILADDIKKLIEIMADGTITDIHMNFTTIFPTSIATESGWNPRLFKIEGARFDKRYRIGEELQYSREVKPANEKSFRDPNHPKILHFMPSEQAYGKKYNQWYQLIHFNQSRQNPFGSAAPSQYPAFKEWKAFNRKRLDYPISASLARKIESGELQI